MDLRGAVTRHAIMVLGAIPGQHGDVLPEPGTLPVPPGTVRLYHYTGGNSREESDRNIHSIAEHGIQRAHAVGSSYGEPNMVWGSAREPNRYIKDFVEFHAKPEDIDIGGPAKGSSDQELRDWEKKGGNVTMHGDVPRDHIMAVHQPWHNHYRYIAGSPYNQEELRNDPHSYDWAKTEDPEAFRGVKKWLDDNGIRHE